MPLLRRAVRRVRKLATAKGTKLTKEQAVKAAKMRIKRDRTSTAGTKFDWAGDGLGTHDKSFGTKENNAWRTKRGKARANVKGASKFGTGRKLRKRNPNAGKGGKGTTPGQTPTGGNDAGYGAS